MCCFVILLLSNEMQISVRRFSAIPHLRADRNEVSYSGYAVKPKIHLNDEYTQNTKEHIKG